MQCLCQSGYRAAADTTTCERSRLLMRIELTSNRRKTKSIKQCMKGLDKICSSLEKKSDEVLSKLKYRVFRTASKSIYDFRLYIPHS